MQEYQPITPENFDEVIANCVLSKISYDVNNPDRNPKYYFEQDGKDAIFTDYFDEFLAFVQKRITLKPLPKEIELNKWFLDLSMSKFEIPKFTLVHGCGSYHLDSTDANVYLRFSDSLPRSQQEELILKIIEVYEGVK